MSSGDWRLVQYRCSGERAGEWQGVRLGICAGRVILEGRAGPNRWAPVASLSADGLPKLVGVLADARPGAQRMEWTDDDRHVVWCERHDDIVCVWSSLPGCWGQIDLSPSATRRLAADLRWISQVGIEHAEAALHTSAWGWRRRARTLSEHLLLPRPRPLIAGHRERYALA